MIGTKNIKSGTGSVPKIIEPGNRVIKVNKVYLDRAPWSDEGYNLMFDCEGPELGSDFQGFFIDKDDEAKGRHKGQVGRIRASRWLYESKTLAGDIEIDRDLEITKFLKHFANAAGSTKWMDESHNKYPTIEEFVEAFNNDAPFKDKFISACVCGKQYESRDGYTNNDLFFPKFSRNGIPFEAEDVENGASQVYVFNEKDHIIPITKPKEVESFSAGKKEEEDEMDFLS